jgi:hypothetical protein
MILPGANSTPAETLTNGWMILPGVNSTPAETLTNGWWHGLLELHLYLLLKFTVPK